MPTNVCPILSYRDARAAIRFLQKAFGFELVACHESEDGRVQHAELRWGDSLIMLSEQTAETIQRFGERAGQGWTYVIVPDADAHHDRASKAGASITTEPADQDYGSRDYEATDTEGNLWSFGTYDPFGG